MENVESLCQESNKRHSHLCPRQVLGVRIGLAGTKYLGFQVPVPDKKMLVIIESDGCFADGVEVATRCTLGHRTLRAEDFGKIAATFVDTTSGKAVRLSPGPDVRQLACDYLPEEKNHYFAMLEAYKIMPEEELLIFRPVQLLTPVEKIVSLPGLRVHCSICGEEISNEREVVSDGVIFCKSCAGETYYRPAA